MSKIVFNPLEHSHRRFNPLTGQWVLVSPQRGKRPWSGQDEKPALEQLPAYDASCFLCPGNPRVSGDINPHYHGTFIFDNDFAALMPDVPEPSGTSQPLFKVQAARGISRVLCFSEQHNKTLPELPLENIREVINAWNMQIKELGKKYLWVQVFENKGETMGCSQAHPHGQIWASDFLPTFIERKDNLLKSYYRQHASNLLIDYVQAELKDGARTVFETEHWLALVPYWAEWPFECMLLPKTHVRRMSELNSQQRDDLALAVKQLTTRYDNLFQCSFPYSMGWHYAPFLENKKVENKKVENKKQDVNFDNRHWQLHALFYPPLLRSASVRKFMVGYEMLAESQRDLTPEQAAQRLREVSDIHYRMK